MKLVTPEVSNRILSSGYSSLKPIQKELLLQLISFLTSSDTTITNYDYNIFDTNNQTSEDLIDTYDIIPKDKNHISFPSNIIISTTLVNNKNSSEQKTDDRMDGRSYFPKDDNIPLRYLVELFVQALGGMRSGSEEIHNHYDTSGTINPHDKNINNMAIPCRLDYFKCPSLLYIDLEINGHQTYGMVDVGSTENMLTRSMCTLLGIRIQRVTHPISAKMANGTIQKFEFAALVPIDYKGHKIDQYFWVTDANITEGTVILLGEKVITSLQLVPLMHLKKVLSLRDPKDRQDLLQIFKDHPPDKSCEDSPKPKKDISKVRETPLKKLPTVAVGQGMLKDHRPLRSEKHYLYFYPYWKNNVTIREVYVMPRVRKKHNRRVHWKYPLVSFEWSDKPLKDLNRMRHVEEDSYGTECSISDDSKDSEDEGTTVAPMVNGDAIFLQKNSEKSRTGALVDHRLTDDLIHVTSDDYELTPEDAETIIHYVNHMKITGERKEETTEDVDDDAFSPPDQPPEVTNALITGLKYEYPDLKLLKTAHKNDVVKLLKVNEDLFEREVSKLTKSTLEPLTVAFEKDLKPFQQKPFHLSLKENRIIADQVLEMEKAGIYEPSNSNFRSNYFLETKEIPEHIDQTKLTQEEYEALRYRGVIDYRIINKHIIDDRQTLQYASEVRDYVTGCKFFTVLDVKNGFLQFKLDQDSREKLAFNAAGRFMQPCVLPQGMKTSPALYQRAIETILQPLLRKCCLVYMDDAIIYSKTWSDHLKHLKQAFECYRKFNVKLNPLKCKFALSSVKYLGHIVEAGGARPDPKKVKAIVAMRTPTTLKEIQVFLGMVNYNQQYIEGWAELCAPLYALVADLNAQLKDKPKTKPGFKWTHECQANFDKLKERLSSKPFLVHFDPTKEHILSCDASGVQIGGILKQIEVNPVTGKNEVRVVEYYSRKLNSTQKRYTSCEKELYAVYMSILHWHYWLWSDKKFTVETDAIAVMYMKKTKRCKLNNPTYSRILLE